MTLDKQSVEIRLNGGLAQGVDAKIVEPPGLVDCQNAVFTREGSTEKRRGFAAVESQRTTTGSLGDVNRLLTGAGNIYAVEETQPNSTGPQVYTQTPSVSDKWRPAGRLPSMVPARVADLSTSRLIIGGQTVAANGKIVAIYYSQDPATLWFDTYYKIIDAETGEVITHETLIHTAIGFPDGNGNLTLVGSTAVFVYFSLTFGFCVRQIDVATSITFGAQVVLAGVGYTGGIGLTALGSTEYAVSIRFAGNNLIRKYDLNNVLQATISLVRDPGELAGNSNYCWFTCGNAGVQEYGQIITSSWALSLAPTNALVTGNDGYKLANVSATRCLLAKTLSANYAAPFAAYTYIYTETAIRDDTGASVGVNQNCYNVELRAMVVKDNRVYSIVTTEAVATTLTSIRLNMQFVMLRDLSQPTQQEQPLPEAFLIQDFAFNALNLFDDGEGNFYSLPVQVTSDQAATYEGAGSPNKHLYGSILRISYNKPNDVFIGQTTNHLSNGSLFLFDSSRIVESNFWQDAVIVGFSTPGAGAVPAGNYSVTCCYSWLDSSGKIHRSRLSLPKTWVAPGGTAAPEFLVLTTGITQKQRTTDGPNAIRIETYITGQNGTVYQIDRYFDNNPNTPAVSFTLGTTITGVGLVYTSGRVLENETPPACTFVAEHRGRLWLINALNRREVWFSKEFEAGEAPAFSPGLTLLANSKTPLVALASMDDKMIFFSEGEIYYTVGDGPTRTGDPPYYPQPYQIRYDVGCDDATTLIDFEGGLAFAYQSAIYVLTADLAATKVSEPIKNILESYPTISQGTVDPINRRLYWLATDSNNQSIVVVFDYQYKVWAIWRTEENSSFETPKLVTQTAFKGDLYYWGSGAGLMAQTAIDGWDDGNKWVTFKLRTPPIKLAGLTGYERTYRVNLQADQLGPCDVAIGLCYDFDDQPADVFTFYNADLAAGSTPPVVRCEVHVPRQKGTAIAVVIADVDPGGSPSANVLGLRIQAFGLIIGIKRGAQKLAPTVRQ